MSSKQLGSQESKSKTGKKGSPQKGKQKTQDEEMKIEEPEPHFLQNAEQKEESAMMGMYRSIKQVQEYYQKFTQHRQRGHSQSFVSAGDVSLTNPGTEVYVVDIKWIELWKSISNYQQSSISNIVSVLAASKNNNQGSNSIKNKNQSSGEDGSGKSEVFVPFFTNERIVLPKDRYLTCTDFSCPYNVNLREDLLPGKDYQLISKEQWKIIEQHYTQEDKIPVYPVRRFFEKIGMGIRTFPVIMYHRFDIFFFPSNQVFSTYFCKRKTWGDFKTRILKLIKDNPDIFPSLKDFLNTKLWQTSSDQIPALQTGCSSTGKLQVKGFSIENFINHSIEQILNAKTLKTEGNEEKTIIVVEVGPQFRIEPIKGEVNDPEINAQCQYCFKIKSLIIHCKCMSASYCCKQCQQNDSKYHQQKCNAIDTIEDWDMNCVQSEEAQNGLTGLKNLKNSCYMSSSIQCLSHTIGLTKYFLKGHFKSELNYQNPLGAKGQLAIAYAKLLKQLWYDDQPSLAPWQFKQTIGRFASNFNNYDQQDSQELLNFLLDGLHEDLNRVQQKPIVPQIESEGFNDEKDAEDCWQNHLKRNQSIIVDLMHGQFKSRVKCPDCEKLSITFDPFMSVSLPIPEIKIVEKNFYWVPYDTSKKCVSDSFKFKSLEQIKTLRKYIATSYDVNQEQFELVIIQDDQVKRILPRYEQISHLNLNNIFIFAMETPLHAFQIQSNIKTLNRENSSYVPEQISSSMGDQWSEKKGANELSKKLKQNYIQVIVNFSIFSHPNCTDENPDKYFPRMVYLRLDESLIQAHLDIFEFLKPLFKTYLEHNDGVSNSFQKIFKKRRNVPVPDRVKASLWDNMTQTQQYEAVFGSTDPSRKKLQDLPYLIQILTRQNFTLDRDRCVFCARENCTNCPLPFEEMTLRQFLNMHGVSTQSYFYYEDHQQKQLQQNANKIEKKKPPIGGMQPATPQKKNQANNLEFELMIKFNSRQCWALYENLVRSKKYQKVYTERWTERQSLNLSQNDKVVIDDCFRQFMSPEKLSHQNTWFCSRCKMHKQAVKKFHVFRSPPILIINLKRFKGMQQKQNTLVHFPIEGLDMSNFVLSQKQKDTDPLIYDLYGVSNHYGQLQGGHYTAYAKNDGKWYRFNDDEVEEIENESSIVSPAAYNLFYARRDINFENLDYQAIKNVLKSSTQNTQNDQLPPHNNADPPIFRFEDDFEMSEEAANVQEEEEEEDKHENNPNEASLSQNDGEMQHQRHHHNRKHWEARPRDDSLTIEIPSKPSQQLNRASRSRSRSPQDKRAI